MKILVAGFPYVRKNYLETFNYYPEKGSIFFLLPKEWKIKRGKYIYHPPEQKNIFTAKAYFHHSHYPIIGGLLKGLIPSLPRYLSSQKYDLLYSCSEPILLTTLYNALWAKICGVKHVMFSWENIDYADKLKGFKGWLHRLILRTNLALSDGLICGNNKGALIHKKYTQKPIAVIPMSGVDPEFFKPGTRNKILEGHDLEDKIIFSFIGAIGYRKGIHTIIRALPAVLKALPNAHFLMAGSGEYEAEIEGLIKQDSLIEHITRVPWVGHDRLLDLLNATDVFLYPSIAYGGWEEQFGYSIAEASLMELPIISTRSGSIEEVVQDGETGLLVESDAVQALAEAMIKLGSDGQLRQQMGKKGRAYMISRYSHAVIAQKFFDFFKIIQSHG